MHASGKPPMTSTISDRRGSLARLQDFKSLLAKASETMGTTGPEEVLRNFIDILKGASPQMKLAITLLTPWALLVTALANYAWVVRAFTALKDLAVSYIYASISIPASHPLNGQVLAWMVTNGLGDSARALALAAPQATAGKRVTDTIDDMYSRLGIGSMSRSMARTKAKAAADKDDAHSTADSLSYLPEVGKYQFFFGGHRMTFERQAPAPQETWDHKGRSFKSAGLAGNETIVISCPSVFAGTRPIQNFLDHVKRSATPPKDRTTTIFRPEAQMEAHPGSTYMWDTGMPRPARGLNAVTLDAHIKDPLIRYASNYLQPQTKKFHANRGIPHRLGLLLYGPPGTGKTSMACSLAEHFRLNVYMLCLSTGDLTDERLESLFEQLPGKCIVLLEDIDCAAQNESDMDDDDYDDYGRPRYPPYQNTGVTLSGLLNVLDGINAVEGRIVIMTSNSPDSLDPALIRPGRVDYKVLFGYASKEVAGKLFRHVFIKSPEELVEGEKLTEADIPALAEKFAEIVPANELTPAELQGYLLIHRGDPAEAIEGATEWVRETLKTKAQGTNVASFTNETGLAKTRSKGNGSDGESHKKLDDSGIADMMHAVASGTVNFGRTGTGVDAANLTNLLGRLGGPGILPTPPDSRPSSRSPPNPMSMTGYQAEDLKNLFQSR